MVLAGVVVSVKRECRTSIVNFLLPKQAGVEDLWLCVQSNMYPAVSIRCVYRHPKASANSFEYLCVQTIMHQEKEFLHTGRF